jgi:hypothetical protein
VPNVVRHLAGIPAGIVLTLLTWIGLGWASRQYTESFQATFAVRPTAPVLISIVLVLLVGAGLGLAASARFMSPVAALIPGAVFFVLGLAIMLLPVQTRFLTDISPLGVGITTYGFSLQGVYPVLGLLLIISGIPPHRWRAKPRAQPHPTGPVVQEGRPA